MKKKKEFSFRHGGSATPQYYCPICIKAHTRHSKIGKRHYSFRK